MDDIILNMKYFQQQVDITHVFDTTKHLYSYPHYVYQILFSVENIAFNFLTFLQNIWLHYEIKLFKSNACPGISQITTLYTSVLNRLKQVRILSLDQQ